MVERKSKKNNYNKAELIDLKLLPVVIDLVTNQSKKSGIKGLANIGNTCFFNSVMQVMTHIPHLQRKLLENVGTAPADEGKLTSALRHFYANMWYTVESPFTPRILFNTVCEKAPRFNGYRQQDAQELLRYLLDNIREEEIKRIKLFNSREKIVNTNPESSKIITEINSNTNNINSEKPLESTVVITDTKIQNPDTDTNKLLVDIEKNNITENITKNNPKSEEIISNPSKKEEQIIPEVDNHNSENGTADNTSTNVAEKSDSESDNEQESNNEQKSEITDTDKPIDLPKPKVEITLNFDEEAEANKEEVNKEKLEKKIEESEQQKEKQPESQSNVDLPIPSSDQIQTFIDEIFGGKLVSIVTCHTCGTPSRVLEPFLDLSISIPIPENKETKKENKKPPNNSYQQAQPKLSKKQAQRMRKIEAERKERERQEAKKNTMRKTQVEDNGTPETPADSTSNEPEDSQENTSDSIEIKEEKDNKSEEKEKEKEKDSINEEANKENDSSEEKQKEKEKDSINEEANENKEEIKKKLLK